MKYGFGFFCICFVLEMHGAVAVDFPTSHQAAAPKSFLSAQSFPTTFNDLSFTERMDVLREGYEPWESDYDDTGRCLTNCAYPGITIQDDLDAIARNTAQARDALYQNQPTPEPIYKEPVVSKKVSFPTPSVEEKRCVPFNKVIPENQTMPVGEPLVGPSRITSPYGERIHPITKKRQVHKGVDFAAPIGTDVYAPASGHVESIWTDQTCGKGLRIKHDNGFASLYCHLNDYTVVVGDKINAGCVVAKTGNTGRSTGPHLHYGLYYNNSIINPDEYIKRQEIN